MHEEVLARCRAALPGWAGIDVDDVEFDDPKGFSSFTMGVRPTVGVDPPAVLYRHLDGKENAILDFEAERRVFLLLGEHEIAAHCHHYDDACRIEAFYRGRTLTADDVFSADAQRGVAGELFRFHRLEPEGLPRATFFELLHDKWGPMAADVLTEQADVFPADERPLCDDLRPITDDRTLERVLRCLPDREPVFCHNDTYHGNVFRLDDGTIKLLDFEFSCRNHAAFDFANFFAETVMVHGLAEPPHFAIAEPRFGDRDLRQMIGFYVAHLDAGERARAAELERLVAETHGALLLSDYMYAMAALPLAVEPIQRIRFLPYAHQRFARFNRNWQTRFSTS